MTVSWRRSATSAAAAGQGRRARAAAAASSSAAIAFSKRLRCPKDTPIFSRSPSVSSVNTSVSMSFWRNSISYWLRPRPLSQSPTSIFVPAVENETDRRGYIAGSSERSRAPASGRIDLFATPSPNDRYVREGDVSNRRTPDIRDRDGGSNRPDRRQSTARCVVAVSPGVAAATSAGGRGARVRRRWLMTSAASVAR